MRRTVRNRVEEPDSRYQEIVPSVRDANGGGKRWCAKRTEKQRVAAGGFRVRGRRRAARRAEAVNGSGNV